MSMFWIPPEEALTEVEAQGPNEGSEQDTAWWRWRRVMQDYTDAALAAGLPVVNFWLIVALPGGDYADKLEWHPEIPMLIPASGTGRFLGVASSRQEVDKLTSEDTNNVHLTFKVRVQGQTAWRELVEFLAQHNMLENENFT